MAEKAIFEKIQTLCERYGLDGEITSCESVVNGHINETYNVIIKNNIDHREKQYIFQCVNQYVFRQPQLIMSNLEIIADWVKSNGSAGCGVLVFLHNKEGKNHVIFEDGSFWRICDYIENSVTYESVNSAALMKKTGYAFGQFQNVLSGMPLDRLAETIPDFHNTKKRIQSFFISVEKNAAGRADEIIDDIKFFERNRELFSTLENLRVSGEMPMRVTHNDTKCNNILFHKITGEPITVIDLDTVMPGLSAHDFGDAIRCAANYTAEDETDLSKVGLNLEYYEAFTDGYITAAKNILTENEVKYMALGAPTIAFELASRFLADYLDGDKYFRVHRPNHNLERARCQMRLCQDMLDKYDIMCSTVSRYYM